MTQRELEDQGLSREPLEEETPEEPTSPDPIEGGSGKGVGDAPGVLAGGMLVEVPVGDRATPNHFYIMYELPPGSRQFVAFQFNSLEQAQQTFGVDKPNFLVRRQSWFDQAVVAESQAEEVVGLGGSWNTLVEEIIRDTAIASGVRDPGLVGRIASDPEMQRIMAQAVVGDWTQEQIKAEQRQTNFWKSELYPGIEAFYGRTTEPEQAWRNYTNNVSPALTALGYKKGADGTYREQIGQMLESGIDAQVFLENAPIFMQAEQNREFFEVLRQRSQQELGKDITFGDWFGLLKGEASPEVQQVAEGAVVAYQAQQQGVGIEEGMLQRLIAERDLSESQARTVFQEVNRAALALGESGLSRGDLTRDDIVSAMADIQSARGLNPEEVRQRVAKIARENDLFDEEKLQFYTGFTPQGTPVKPGLQALAPESA